MITDKLEIRDRTLKLVELVAEAATACGGVSDGTIDEFAHRIFAPGCDKHDAAVEAIRVAGYSRSDAKEYKAKADEQAQTITELIRQREGLERKLKAKDAELDDLEKVSIECLNRLKVAATAALDKQDEQHAAEIHKLKCELENRAALDAEAERDKAKADLDNLSRKLDAALRNATLYQDDLDRQTRALERTRAALAEARDERDGAVGLLNLYEKIAGALLVSGVQMWLLPEPARPVEKVSITVSVPGEIDLVTVAFGANAGAGGSSANGNG